MAATPSSKQNVNARRFRNLHHSGKLLILPNIWDPLGALVLQDLSFQAVATASAAIALTNGYDDGEKIPLDMLLTILRRIANAVEIPVSADIESGFADNEEQLVKNIRNMIETGIAGINIEDTDKKTNSLLPLEQARRRIELVRKTSEQLGVPLFINARSDVYLRGQGIETPESKLEESIRRGLAYKDAGADCFYPITMNRAEDIQKTVQSVQMPINILLMDGIPTLRELTEMRVARVSLGPGFLKVAIRAMKNAATKLQNLEGMSEIIENEITSPYLKELVNKIR